MLKVGGFPEYSPSQQRVFDNIKKTIAENYARFGYEHIHTPSVERNDVLLKGGEESSKEIFGLYGLASGGSDLKKYSLIFDQTVPFARYVIDRRGELTFPFKRYQIQPLWRGERAQRGRFREFFQADIDVVWPSGHIKTMYYDAEVMMTLRTTISAIQNIFFKEKKVLTHYNNRKLLFGLFSSLTDDTEKQAQLSKLFDSYYKISSDEFDERLRDFVGDSFDIVKKFLACSVDDITEDMFENDMFAEGVREIKELTSLLRSLHPEASEMFVFDPYIVRGLDYYTGTVFETFFTDDMSLGSICSGGRYDNLTQSLDKKADFEGVGGSIGLSRLCYLLIEELGASVDFGESYLFLCFDETRDETLSLMADFHRQGKQAEMYPQADKLGKQFGYADKKGLSHVVIYGAGEKEKGVYVVKDMKSGEQVEVKM